MRHLVLLLVVILSASACGDHAGGAGSGVAGKVEPTAIPWTSATPAPPAPVVPTIAPPPATVARCAASALRFESGDNAGGAMGEFAGTSFLVNVDKEPCLVAGAFTIRFIDSRGVVALASGPTVSVGWDAPGWAVAGRAWLHWSVSWCDRAHPLVAVELEYEGTTYRASMHPVAGGAACEAVGASPIPRITVLPIGAPPTPSPPVRPRLRPSLSAPARARAGDVLTYSVALENVSPEPVALSPCPAYLEWLMGRATGTQPPPSGFPSAKPWVGVTHYAGISKAAYALNCDGVGSILPGASVRFEMRIDVPLDGEGEGTLRWELREENAYEAVATVVIDPRP